MNRLRILSGLPGLIACAALAHEPAPDPTRLPIGDGKISTTPVRGHVMNCPSPMAGGGAHVQGPWIRADGTFDFNAKAVVDGVISWPSEFLISAEKGMRVIASNNLPKHPTGVFPVGRDTGAYRYDRNPNPIRQQEFRLELPLLPAVAEAPSCLPMGPIGFLLTGGVFFNAIDAQGKDAVAHEVQDRCQGHPERGGAYHYHSLTTCLEDAGQRSAHSALVGYAMDGFGIYGRHGEGGRLLSNADLDECHGHAHEIEWDAKRISLYHYHATWEYPYTLGCFRGQPQRLGGSTANLKPPPRKPAPKPRPMT